MLTEPYRRLTPTIDAGYDARLFVAQSKCCAERSKLSGISLRLGLAPRFVSWMFGWFLLRRALGPSAYCSGFANSLFVRAASSH